MCWCTWSRGLVSPHPATRWVNCRRHWRTWRRRASARKPTAADRDGPGEADSGFADHGSDPGCFAEGGSSAAAGAQVSCAAGTGKKEAASGETRHYDADSGRACQSVVQSACETPAVRCGGGCKVLRSNDALAVCLNFRPARARRARRGPQLPAAPALHRSQTATGSQAGWPAAGAWSQ